MEILGIGMQELVFIVIIALIVLGPKDMQKAGRSIGRWLNQLVKSDGWKVFQQTSREIQNLPRTLMREANMELQEIQKDINKPMDLRPNPSPVGLRAGLPPSKEAENSSQPPAVNPDAPASNDNTDSNADGIEAKHD